MTRRKIRIVCISDTHNQTPKLPAGDILIHAGDLTNQGSYSELKKTVSWLEKADFEHKIVVAGNHDTTLDPPFFHSAANKWKWPAPQDPTLCKALLTSSPSLTYLEHASTVLSIASSTSTQPTRLKVFGSPFSPGHRGWAFQYADGEAAQRLWSVIEHDVDVLVTHTPALGLCDWAGGGEMAGCAELRRAVERVRPCLHVCGHIHAGRGVQRVRWKGGAGTEIRRDTAPLVEGTEEDNDGIDVESMEVWDDPGKGNNKKLSRVDLTGKAGRKLDWGVVGRRETCVVNAAILGAREIGGSVVVAKPIVVDIEVSVSGDEGR